MKAIIHFRSPDDPPNHGNTVIGIDRDGSFGVCRFDLEAREWKFFNSQIERLTAWFDVPSRSELYGAQMVMAIAEYQREQERIEFGGYVMNNMELFERAQQAGEAWSAGKSAPDIHEGIDAAARQSYVDAIGGEATFNPMEFVKWEMWFTAACDG